MLIDGVSRDLVEKAGCGVYSEPENTLELVETLKTVKVQQERLIEMGVAGYHYARENFNRTKLAADYRSYLRQIHESL